MAAKSKETGMNEWYAGYDIGWAVGKAIGRFCEKHNITDVIPENLHEEYNQIIMDTIVKTQKEVYHGRSLRN